MRFAVFAIILMGFPATQAVAGNCVEGLIPVGDGEIAYQERGNRCEGLLMQPFSSTGLRVVGFQRGASRFEQNDRLLTVRSPGSAEKRITVVSVKTGVNYRLDAVSRGLSFSFPLSVITNSAVSLRDRDIAATVCVAQCSGLAPTLVPAEVSSAASQSGRVAIFMRATVNLAKLKVRIVDASGSSVLFDRDLAEDLDVPAGQLVKVEPDMSKLTSGSADFEVQSVGRSLDLQDLVRYRLRFD